MVTDVYGSSDDSIYFGGDISGQIDCYGDCEEGSKDNAFIACSDGTVFTFNYGGTGLGIWKVTLLRQGELFDRIDTCLDEDAEVYSDKLYFKDGLKWAFSTTEWEKVR